MFQAVAEIVLEVFCYGTGYCLVWVVTFGRSKALKGHDDLVTLAGLLFWALIGVVLFLLLAR